VDRLKIIKPAKGKNLGNYWNFNQLQEQLLCQFEVPGVGRLRTGERHSDFHMTGCSEAGKSKKNKKDKGKS
jgi:hypothetical protein